MRGIVYGRGINDAGLPVSRKTYSNGVMTSSWVCPKYEMWKGMLRRCLDEKFKMKAPRYLDCSVCDGWLRFSNFEKWIGDDDISDLQLDKDIKVKDNKHYSPENCCLVPSRVNTLMLSVKSARGELPLGVHLKSNRFYSQISDQFNNKQRYLGYYDNKITAHRAWQLAKIDHIKSTVDWWASSDYNFNKECAESLLNMAESIRSDYDNNIETVLN